MRRDCGAAAAPVLPHRHMSGATVEHLIWIKFSQPPAMKQSAH
jgi:hypothetical protein